MSCQLHLFILKSYMPRLHFPRHRYELFFVSPHCCYNLISLVSIWLSISTSSFWNKSPIFCMWAKQAVRFDPRLTRENYLQTNTFPNLMVVEQEEYPHALRKATGGGVTNKVVKVITSWMRLYLILGTSTSASTIYHITWWVGMMAEYLPISGELGSEI